MINKELKRESLRVIIGANFLIVALVVLSLGAVFIYAGTENSKSLQVQKDLSEKYDSAIALKAAIDSLAYFSAELSNSLADASLDSFENASTEAETLINKVSDKTLRDTLLAEKNVITENALSALDYYIIDDRLTGDMHMATVRNSAATLKTSVEAHVIRYQNTRDAEAEGVIRRTKTVEHVAIAMAAGSLAILLISAFLMWRALFRPVHSLINAISGAAKDTSRAEQHKVQDLPANEIGMAGEALNHLLSEVSSAISQEKNRAVDAERAEKKWQALFDGSPDAIIVLDLDTSEIIDYNPSTKKLLCMGLDNLPACDTMTGFEIHSHELDIFKAFLTTIQSDGFARSDVLSCGIDDKKIPVSVVGVSMPLPGRNAALMHIRDISAQRQHEDELETARIEAERANEAKRDFLAKMSHEIRTPMNGVLGIAEVLQGTELDDQQRELTSIVVSSGVALLQVINDILDFSKIEAGKLELNVDEFDIHDLVGEVIALMRARCVSKKIDLILDIGTHVPRHVVGDASRLRQVITNVVGNAVKFTEKGSVVVSLDGKRAGQLVELDLQVKDTGIGIPASDLDRIFEKFEQVDGSKARQFEGTGLGLAISKSFIELMDGTIIAQSDVGIGSTFSLSLTLPVVNCTEKSDEELRNGLDHIHVLVASDNAINQRALSDYFDKHQMRYQCVTSSLEAREALRQAIRACDKYHLIFLDSELSEDVARPICTSIEEDERFSGLPMVVIGRPEQSGAERGFVSQRSSAILDVPLSHEEITEILHAVLSDAAIGQVRALAGSTISSTLGNTAKAPSTLPIVSHRAVGAKPKILIVEDNVVNQQVLKMMIGDEYDVEIADNGRIAVDLHLKFLPDLIFMDLSMPVMNGYEAVEKIRGNEDKHGLEFTPIIAATAHAHNEEAEKCLQSGMNAVVTKPIRKPDIEVVLEAWIGARSLKSKMVVGE